MPEESSAAPNIFIVTIAPEQDRGAAVPAAVFAPGHSWLTHPSKANLYWLRQAGLRVPDDPIPEQIWDSLADQICDVF